ncbi:G-protein coupled receptor 4-like [Anabas testudineus]|uniref:G-protein coupled receptors family 1 profile domain-containing protein n=1 Tax=Anabas testudineus TaxID=64144 RepID=A0A7N6B8W6_ANATE|nr:G-protein coupled receptor 4-like [Anabas testudineus]
MTQNYVNNTSQEITNNTRTDQFKEIRHVAACIIISVELPLTLVAIFAVYALVRKNHVAPIYVINLLISDLIQLCCMIIREAETAWFITRCIYHFGLMASVGFMVCIALERYLVIAWPLWYRNRRTIKISVVVCVVVWTFSLVCFLLFYFRKESTRTVFGVFLLLPFPLLIFSLVGTIKALSAAISVRAEEKRRIVGLLVLVLLIYTLLFLPGIILFLADKNARGRNLGFVSFTLFKLSPLADLFLYIFLRKGAVNKVLSCLCCCRKNRTSQTSSSVNDGNTHTVTSM